MPTKALATNPTLEYEHYLAAELGMTVDEMRTRMSHPEFVRWGMYHARIVQRRQLSR